MVKYCKKRKKRQYFFLTFAIEDSFELGFTDFFVK